MSAPPPLSVTLARHAVPYDVNKLSPLQRLILECPAPVRIFSAPTGAGKSYAFIKAAERGQRVLFVVPTRRLAQNLAQDAADTMARLDPPVTDAVAIWTSDEVARQRAADPSYRPWKARLRQVNDFERERFLVATPESLALMLLHHASGGLGVDRFGPAALIQHFQNIVFDEFHSIDARGFGLCAFMVRLCVFTAGANPGRTDVPRVTFLSATPIDLVPVLKALGVPANAIAVDAETVIDNPPPGTTPGLRVLHGEVRIDVVREPDMLTLLENYEDDIHARIARGQQFVVILDTLAELLTERARFAAFFDRLGIRVARRLAINSYDDAAPGGEDGLFNADRSADPRTFDVLLATSSVEMGVTFRAGMLAMDPGHDALSFVQRVGRVARADEPGLVLVRQDPARDGKRPWLRALLPQLAAESTAPIPISRFNRLVLATVERRFKAESITLEGDTPPDTYRSMSQRAVWASCLFWQAMDHKRPKHSAGQRVAFDAMRPGKVGYIGHLLQTVAGNDPRPTHPGADWVGRFLVEAETLRDIAPSVTVIVGEDRRGKIPLQYLDSFPALRAFPLVADDQGGWKLYLDRQTGEILRDSERLFAPRRRTILMPDGQQMTVDAARAAEDAIRTMKKTLDRSCTAAEKARLTAAIELVRLTGLIPSEADLPAIGAVVA